MAQQVITPTVSNGADSRRVLDTLTPINSEAGPTVNATYIGQIFVNTDGPTVYIAVTTNSESPADDWVEMAQAQA